MMNLKSRVRRELLGYYFTNPTASHYLRELARLFRADPANLSRELARLENEGIFVSEWRGSHKYYQLNRQYLFYRELRSIIFKTAGVAGQLREALGKIGGIEEVYLYGSFASNQADAASDIDVLIVGRANPRLLESAIRKLERKLRREINYTILTPEELRSRRATKDPFLEDVWRNKKIALLAAS